jgi:hypothetical protein
VLQNVTADNRVELTPKVRMQEVQVSFNDGNPGGELADDRTGLCNADDMVTHGVESLTEITLSAADVQNSGRPTNSTGVLDYSGVTAKRALLEEVGTHRHIGADARAERIRT